ncbi:MAG: OmpA family protein [Pseudomonadota bacterium]
MAGTDGDLVPDATDLDDDNDGILDTDEGFVAGVTVFSEGLVTNALFNENYVDSGNPGTPYASEDNNFVPPEWTKLVTPDLSSDSTIAFHTQSESRVGLGDFDSSPTGGSFMGFRGSEGISQAITIADADQPLGIRYEYTEYTRPGSSPDATPVNVEFRVSSSAFSSSTDGTIVDDVPNLAESGGTEGTWETRTAVFTPSDFGLSAGTIHIAITANGSQFETWAFVDSYGVDSSFADSCVDTDGDDICDHLDLDSDNDGISDLVESGADFAALDPDGNGVIDGAQFVDDGDGLADAIETTNGADSGTTPRDSFDSAGDSLADFRDLDSDDDGLPDSLEGQSSASYIAYPSTVDGTADADDDGILDVFDGTATFGSDGVTLSTFSDPTNTTSSGQPDAYALDADGDTNSDAAESGGALTPSYANPDGSITDSSSIFATLTNSDGIADEVDYRESTGTDTDGDGVNDQADAANTDACAPLDPSPSCIDTDGDGFKDFGTSTGQPVEPNTGADIDPCVPNASAAACLADADSDNINDFTEGLIGTDPNDQDTDNDGLNDDVEVGANNMVDPGETNPLDADSDDDGISDGDEVNGTGPLASFAATNPVAFDSDTDTLSDGLEVGVTTGISGGNSDGNSIAFAGTAGGFTGDANALTTTNPNAADTDSDGLNDNVEDANGDGATVNTIGGTGTSGSGETDPAVADTDGDGLSDGNEVNAAGPLSGIGSTSPLDTDTDDGGVDDGTEVNADSTDPTAGNGADDQDDPDVDGLTDPQEAVLGTDPNDADSDNDGLNDGAEVGANGTLDAGETDPLDADSDEDGINDGDEVNGTGPLASFAATDPVVFDSDIDGLGDGLEVGVTTGVSGGTSDGNSTAFAGTAGGFTGDADAVSTTNPNSADSDSDGLNDGVEDANGDGATVNTIGGTGTVGTGETDPNNDDTDGDTLLDGDEVNAGGPLSGIGSTDPLDTDTDDGGVDDGTEVTADSTDPTAGNGADDEDDSDMDGLTDPQETVLGTDPNDADSDNDGLTDGAEVGANGVLDAGETNPLDADSDDDGLRDGDEVNGTGLLAGFAATDPLVLDSDTDGLGDGLEAGAAGGGVAAGASDGNGTPYAGTAPGFTGDADPMTTTDPNLADTDGDGLSDGVEDLNGDGATVNTIGATGSAGSGETNPAMADTDSDGLNDGDEANGSGPLALLGATDPLDTDTDDGGSQDGTEVLTDGTNPTAGNSLDDLQDTDMDGISDVLEGVLGTDPDDADSDNDGLTDGNEIGNDGSLDAGDSDPLDVDTDDDGLGDGAEALGLDATPATGDETDPVLADTDADGLSDGLELGVTAGLPGGISDTGAAMFVGTNTGSPNFAIDADSLTTTDPTVADSDADGLLDGTEDANGDGATAFVIGDGASVGSGETDPNIADTDGDGLNDGDETNASGPLVGIGATDPLDTDTDDGGSMDGTEVLADGTDPTLGNGGDDLSNDPDGDGLSTGQELALGTDPNDPDSDGDGIGDGEEVGFDGSLDPGDSDPLDADTDDDGLSDGAERFGSDGMPGTGDETNPLNPDTDGDGLADGLELGVTAPIPGGTSAGGEPFTGTETLDFAADSDPTSTTDPTLGDTDMDGLADGVEDDDRDGATANVLGDSTSSGSGETDPNNADTDGDGLSDGVEVNGTGPLAGFGPTDPLDTDTDNGGVNDFAETIAGTDPGMAADDIVDVDGDMVAATEDPDDADPCNPSNTVAACDSDNDGISDGEEIANGTDPNDPDTDGDGVADGDENMDADMDGINDGADEDSDNDGIPDVTEIGGNGSMPPDTDGDGLADFFDPDADNDGVPDAVETDADGDGDGIPNHLDPDADDDGLPDVLDAGLLGAPDTDGDGIVDAFDVDATGGSDANGDGVDDALIGRDTDGDGVPDLLDIDADNDGIPDTVEADLDVALDADGDGVNDAFDVDLVGGGDANGDGVVDTSAVTDTDGDGTPDYLDLDADNDGAFDVVEAGGVDVNGDALIDSPALEGSDPAPVDTDGDAVPDYRDLDSDGDGAPDAASTEFADFDMNGDGRIDAALDSDADGIADVIDRFAGFGTFADTDGDGIPDETEGTNDTDGDGIPDFEDVDSDGDGILDSDEVGPDPLNPVDTDGDGVPDYRDTDSDNDGIDDALEGTGDFNFDGIPDRLQNEGELETAVSGSGGGGAIAPVGLLALVLLLLVGRLRGRVAPMELSLATAVLVALPLGALADHGASSCNRYVAKDGYAYDGRTPRADGAAFDGCWYGGAGYGYSYVSPDEEANNFRHDRSENHDDGFNVFIGRYFHPNVFAELKYADLGEAGITNRNPDVAAAFPDAAITYKVPSLMIGYEPFRRSALRPYLKIGASAIANKAKGGPVPFAEQTSVQLALGAGVKWTPNRGAWFLRVDADSYDEDAWYASAAIGRHLGARRVPIRHSAASVPAVDGPHVRSDVENARMPSPAVRVADRDGDGVADRFDACPETPAGVAVNAEGCHSDGSVTTTSARTLLAIVRFDVGSPIVAADDPAVVATRRFLDRHQNSTVEIGGHTDADGEADYNLQLSVQRAARVRELLERAGIDPRRINIAGYGESRPIESNSTVEGRRQNRRVEIVGEQ